MRLSRLLLPMVLAAACTGTPAPQVVVAPVPTVTTSVPKPTPAATPSPARATVAPWVVGASPLPLAAGGFGQVLPTPPQLRNRQLQQADNLAPPSDTGFHSTVSAVTPSIRTRMGDTYRAGCPVALRDLRYLTLTFRGFDHHSHTGELIVATTAVTPTTNAFRALFALDFPLEQMVIATSEDLHAKPTGDGNDTAAFVCRAARGQTRFSAHAYGLAIDLNPFQNPYVRGDLVLPELASAYTQRGWVRRGMFEPGSAAVRAFTSQGFTWGGSFRRPKDYQHMSLNGT